MSATGHATFDRDAFARLQSRFTEMWPWMTIRGRDEERTLIVVSSINFAPLPQHIVPLVPAYEERYLFYVLALARAPHTRVVYVTSQPILPRLLDYYLGLVPGIDRRRLQERVVPVSVGDWSIKPLSDKILERPRLIERLRSLVPDPQRAVILPFMMSDREACLALALGVPVYGPHPDLAWLGTKSGSRQVFAAAGVPHPRGAEGVRTAEDVTKALVSLLAGRPVDAAIVKLDALASGLGNATIDLLGASSRDEVLARVRHLRPEDTTLDAAAYLSLLEREGGIVEERLTGEEVRSPSVQLRNGPDGFIEVLTTHDQILAGVSRQSYVGCRFPANPAYARLVTHQALAIGSELSRRGVLGRYGIDFLVTRRGGEWLSQALEINLRNGGTTHPALALLALTGGEYDVEAARWLAGGMEKHYVATDHLEVPGLRWLTPDDVLDVIEDSGLSWNDETRTGLVFHLLSGVGVAGLVGVTAIADSVGGADALFERTQVILAAAAGGVRGEH